MADEALLREILARGGGTSTYDLPESPAHTPGEMNPYAQPFAGAVGWTLEKMADPRNQALNFIPPLGLGVVLSRGFRTAAQEGALARTLRSVPRELRRGLQEAPEDLAINLAREFRSGAGAYYPQTGGMVPKVTVGAADSPDLLGATLRHEIVGHALPDMAAIHPATRRRLQAFADQVAMSNPSIRRNIEGQAMKPAEEVSPLLRTEGLAYPAELNWQTAAQSGVMVAPEEIRGSVEALRLADRLQRAARRNPEWAASLRRETPPLSRPSYLTPDAFDLTDLQGP